MFQLLLVPFDAPPWCPLVPLIYELFYQYTTLALVRWDVFGSSGYFIHPLFIHIILFFSINAPRCPFGALSVPLGAPYIWAYLSIYNISLGQVGCIRVLRILYTSTLYTYYTVFQYKCAPVPFRCPLLFFNRKSFYFTLNINYALKFLWFTKCMYKVHRLHSI